MPTFMLIQFAVLICIAASASSDLESLSLPATLKCGFSETSEFLKVSDERVGTAYKQILYSSFPSKERLLANAQLQMARNRDYQTFLLEKLNDIPHLASTTGGRMAAFNDLGRVPSARVVEALGRFLFSGPMIVDFDPMTRDYDSIPNDRLAAGALHKLITGERRASVGAQDGSDRLKDYREWWSKNEGRIDEVMIEIEARLLNEVREARSSATAGNASVSESGGVSASSGAAPDLPAGQLLKGSIKADGRVTGSAE